MRKIKKNPKSAKSEIETRPREMTFESKIRTSNIGLETRTNLKNTTGSIGS